MDPNQALIELRAAIEEARTEIAATTPRSLDQIENVADLFQALDEWLLAGGFAPREWNQIKRFFPLRIGTLADADSTPAYQVIAVEPDGTARFASLVDNGPVPLGTAKFRAQGANDAAR